jgi:hypothetical protein
MPVQAYMSDRWQTAWWRGVRLGNIMRALVLMAAVTLASPARRHRALLRQPDRP